MSDIKDIVPETDWTKYVIKDEPVPPTPTNIVTENFLNGMSRALKNTEKKAIGSKGEVNKIFRFFNPATTGLAYPISGSKTNIFRSWQQGSNPIPGMFVVSSGGYAVRYTGDRPITVDVQLSSSIIFTDAGWYKLSIDKNDSEEELVRLQTNRTPEQFNNGNLMLTMYLEPNDAIWVKVAGSTGTIKQFAQANLSIIPR